MRLSIAQKFLIGLPLIAAVFFAVIFRPVLSAPSQQGFGCTVTENYQEAVDENIFSLLRLLSLTNTENNRLHTAEQFGINYALLISMRQYHEDMHDRLPACAKGLNQELIQTITATQDVMTLSLASATFTETNRYEKRLDRAQNRLNDAWPELTSASRFAELTNPSEADEQDE